MSRFEFLSICVMFTLVFVNFVAVNGGIAENGEKLDAAIECFTDKPVEQQ